MATKSARKAVDDPAAIEPVLEVDEAFALTSRDLKFLNRVTRFLTIVQLPAFLTIARREGYTPEEHATGLALYKRALGLDRPLDHLFLRATPKELETDEGQRLLQELDTFENTWFVRARAIIQRVVAPERRQQFESAFFADLAQQPLGPGVVGSVTTFLSRVDGLEASAQPDAKAVLEMLRSRGLGPAKIAAVRKLLSDLAALQVPAVPGDVQEARAADAEQRQALADLHDWYRDWATTLRTVYAYRDLVRLGLIAVRREATDDEPHDNGDEPGPAAAQTPNASASKK